MFTNLLLRHFERSHDFAQEFRTRWKLTLIVKSQLYSSSRCLFQKLTFPCRKSFWNEFRWSLHLHRYTDKLFISIDIYMLVVLCTHHKFSIYTMYLVSILWIWYLCQLLKSVYELDIRFTCISSYQKKNKIVKC